MFHYENPNVSLAKGNLPYYMPNALCSTFPILFPFWDRTMDCIPMSSRLSWDFWRPLDDAERMESIVYIVSLVGKIPSKPLLTFRKCIPQVQ
jgi:hypothetical protein